MQVIRPFTITDSVLTSNIGDNDDYADYNPATTYALDDIVIGTDFHEYQSLAGSNTGNALTDAAWWLDLGFNRKWRMFDLSNTSQSTESDEIDVTVQVDGLINSVSLLNIAADTVQIIATSATEGEVYNQTFNLTSDSGINNWYDYFFEPIIRKGDLVVTDIPLISDLEVQVILTATGSTVRVGTMIVGQGFLMGATVYGATVGIQDYSRKVADDFGNWTIVERAFAKRARFKVIMDSAKVDAAQALLASLRAQPVVYQGTDQYASTYIFGFFKDFSISIDKPSHSYCELDIEGLT